MQPVTVVNERLAKTFNPGQSPLGMRIYPPGANNPWFTVIGVAADMKQAGVNDEAGTRVLVGVIGYSSSVVRSLPYDFRRTERAIASLIGPVNQ